MVKNKKAIVLSSGGVDSTTSMAIAKAEGYDIYSLSFRYGQRHSLELEAAKEVAKAFGAREHLVIDIDLGRIGGSALTDDIEVPKARPDHEMQKKFRLHMCRLGTPFFFRTLLLGRRYWRRLIYSLV